MTRADDTLPKRYFDDRMKLKLAKGHRIERGKFEALLSRYYELRGWDDGGRPSAERVVELEELCGIPL